MRSARTGHFGRGGVDAIHPLLTASDVRFSVLPDPDSAGSIGITSRSDRLAANGSSRGRGSCPCLRVRRCSVFFFVGTARSEGFRSSIMPDSIESGVDST